MAREDNFTSTVNGAAGFERMRVGSHRELPEDCVPDYRCDPCEWCQCSECKNCASYSKELEDIVADYVKRNQKPQI
jgi:hypothetical protein